MQLSLLYLVKVSDLLERGDLAELIHNLPHAVLLVEKVSLLALELRLLSHCLAQLNLQSESLVLGYFLISLGRLLSLNP